MIRSLHPADIPSLLWFLSKAPVNEAKTPDRLGQRQDGLGAIIPLFRGYFSERERRHSVVYVHRGLIRGLTSIRSRKGPSAWEIERLLLGPGQEVICPDLLEKLASLGCELGVERLFLRLDSRSPLVDMVRRAGFCCYLTQSLYFLEQISKPSSLPTLSIVRPKLETDELRLFQLYSDVMPPQVRSAEGLTLQEWSQSRDRGASKEWVFEQGGEVSAWLRVKMGRRMRQVDVITARKAADLDTIVNNGLALLDGRGPIYWLIPEFQQPLRELLEERGFRQEAEYFCLIKQLAARVREPQLVPLQA